MSILSQLSYATNLISLRDMLVLWFENENAKDINLVCYLETLAEAVKCRIKERGELIMELKSFTWLIDAFESIKLLTQLQNADKVTNLELVGVIEDEKLFGDLSDEDAVQEFKVNTDLTATISELKSDWYINFCDFFMVYLPRNPPIIYNDLYEDYLNKLSASRKRAKIATKDLPIIPRATNIVYITDDFDIYLGQRGPLQCRFPWCKYVCVDRRFWESLVCLDPGKKGWIIDEHIELWVNYMWHDRPVEADWAM
ncbi:hypothetical protein Tco_1206238, partial [Tanacetum coccineum]